MSKRILIHGATVADGSGSEPYAGWLLTEGALIKAMGTGDAPAEAFGGSTEAVDAAGALLMPGAIDAHVHFREPGLTHKATIASESRAAVAGGVTSYIEMPNTRPATVSLEALEQKEAIAEADSAANYAFMLGATADNLTTLQRADYSRIAAVKVFMGSSTGNMLLDGESALRAVFADQPGRVVVHAEDQHTIDALTAKYSPLPDPRDMAWHTRLRPNECCVRATERAMELAQRYGTRLHIAHVTTREECALFDPHDSPAGRQITAEVSPHHLTRCADDYAALGARIKMNPAVKSAADRDALRLALAEGRLDIVATDHAPHLLSEKEGDVLHAVSGAPIVQFSLPLMLTLYDDPALVARRMAAAPAALFGIEGRGVLRPGYFADIVIVRSLPEPHTISDADALSICGWTAAAGLPVRYAVARTIVNGDTGARALRFRP